MLFLFRISTVCPGPVITSFSDNMSANQDPEAKSSDAENPTKKVMIYSLLKSVASCLVYKHYTNKTANIDMIMFT